MTMSELLNGRESLRCDCGEELWVEQVDPAEDSVWRFVPCKCGSDKPVQVPHGSIFGSIGGVSPAPVWGPPKDSAN